MHAHINGIQLVYEDRGLGTPIVLIHGFPFRGAMWQPQVAGLVEQYRVIVPDLRGFGDSEVPPGTYTMDVFADDIAGLLDELGIEQAIIGGLSMGGYIAFAFLRRYAERVRGLVLADTRALPDTEEGRAGREVNVRLVESNGPGALADKVLPNLLAPAAPMELHAQVRGFIEQTQPQGIIGALRGMAQRPDSSDLLPTITVPTLVVVGSDDILSPPEEMRTLHNATPGSRFVVIPGAGHLAPLEQPDAFNAALHDFLAPLKD